MNPIRSRREALRVEFSQNHLAKLSGIPQTTISLIERGLIEPTPEQRQNIARALQCEVKELWPEQEVSHEAV